MLFICTPSLVISTDYVGNGAVMEVERRADVIFAHIQHLAFVDDIQTFFMRNIIINSRTPFFRFLYFFRLSGIIWWQSRSE